MTYTFNFTWNDVLAEAGLHIYNNNEIAKTIFVSNDNRVLHVPGLNEKVDVQGFVKFMHFVQNEKTEDTEFATDDAVTEAIAKLSRSDIALDIIDGEIDSENYNLKRFLSYELDNLQVALGTDDYISAYAAKNVDYYIEWKMIPVQRSIIKHLL